MISLVAGIGLVAGSLSATASEFGGGWAHAPNTSTLYNSNAPTVEKQHSAASKARTESHSTGSVWAKNYMFGTS